MITEQKKVNILGTEILIDFCKEQEDPKLRSLVGYFDGSAARIVVKILEPDAMSMADLDKYQKEIIRHEILHAFLYESGLDACSGSAENWALCEEMVDWFAIQSPKILKAYQETGVL